MEPIADLAALKPVVDELVQRGLMIELTPPGRGQMVSHNLYQEDEQQELRASFAGSRPAGATPRAAERAASPGPDRTPGWSEELAELRGEIAELREWMRQLEGKLSSRPK